MLCVLDEALLPCLPPHLHATFELEAPSSVRRLLRALAPLLPLCAELRAELLAAGCTLAGQAALAWGRGGGDAAQGGPATGGGELVGRNPEGGAWVQQRGAPGDDGGLAGTPFPVLRGVQSPSAAAAGALGGGRGDGGGSSPGGSSGGAWSSGGCSSALSLGACPSSMTMAGRSEEGSWGRGITSDWGDGGGGGGAALGLFHQRRRWGGDGDGSGGGDLGMFVELEGRGPDNAGGGGDGMASIRPEAMALLAADVLGAVLSQRCVDDVPEDELCQVRVKLCWALQGQAVLLEL